MPQYGILLQITHTGTSRSSIFLSDVQDGVDVLNSFRKAGAVYIPVGGTALLVYSGDVAISFETGAIRKFIQGGYLTASFFFGADFLAALPASSLTSLGFLFDPTGFEDYDTQAITFTDATRRLTLAPTGASYNYRIHGVQHVGVAAKTIVVGAGEGLHAIWLDGDNLVELPFTRDNLHTYPIVAIIYWDATNSKHILLAMEFHTCWWPKDIHWQQHTTRGTQYISGLLPGNFTLGDGSLNTHAQFSVANGEILDEDVPTVITSGAPQVLSPTLNAHVIYRSGLDVNGIWRDSTPDVYPFIQSGKAGTTYVDGLGRIAYNRLNAGTWDLQPVPNGSCVLGHIMACNDQERPLKVILGQGVYNSVGAAQAGAVTELNNLLLNGMPFPEFMFIGTVIFQGNNTFGNVPKARIVQTSLPDSPNYVPWLGSVNSVSVSIPAVVPNQGATENTAVPYTLLTGDNIEVLVVTTAGANIQVTLPPIVENDRRLVTVKLATASGVGQAVIVSSNPGVELVENNAVSVSIGIPGNTLTFKADVATNNWNIV